MGDHDLPAFLPFSAQSVEVGRSSKCGFRLQDPTVSKHHATLTPNAEGVEVIDLDSTFGTFVNGARIRHRLARPDDVLQFGPRVVYRVQSGGLLLETASGMSLFADQISIAAAGKLLLQQAHFSVAPNRFVGIIGPSGTGKSTLLNCLASYYPPGTGRLLCDGCCNVQESQENLDKYRASLAYVPQRDAIYGSLTIREHLQFAARLRLAEQESESARDRRVDEVLEVLDLTAHADTRAGRISGGQCKRLSVAIELLERPRLLLLDEPTTGLDPASETAMMVHLRKVSARGTTVLCTTHLLDNIHLFDQVIVLGIRPGSAPSTAASGCVAYSGAPDGLFDHFNVKTYADVFERLSKGEFDPSKAADAPAPPSTAPEDRSTRGSDRSSVRSPQRPGESNRLSSWNDLVGTNSSGGAWSQMLFLAWRSMLLIARDRGLLAMMTAQPLLLGFLVCLTQYYESGIAPLAFLSAVIAIWLGMNNAARDLVRERTQYVRERLRGLRPDAYLGAKWTVYTLVGVAQITVLLLVLRLGSVFIFSGPLNETLTLRSFFFVLLLCYLGGLALGCLISVIAKTEEAAVAALPLLIMPQLLLSALATGEVNQSHSKPRPFKPLAVYLTSPHEVTTTDKTGARLAAKVVDGLSLLCFSRPAVSLLEAPRVDGYSPRRCWLGDLFHLLLLVLAAWTALILAFLHAERNWPRLIGLG